MGDGNPISIPIEGELDLHSFEPSDVASVVEEYIHAACRSGFQTVRIVHGRGRGVQRGIVQNTLEQHPRVEEFWDDTGSHLGATIARLQRVV
jgi:DNA-nicking Smr family endonuclease